MKLGIASGSALAHDTDWHAPREVTDSLGRHRVTPSPADRLRAGLVVHPITGCWEWQRCRNFRGYGEIGAGPARLLTHRLAYAIWVGDVPAGALVCHHCDNPTCCNPTHLYLGDPQANVDDTIARGRHVAPTGLCNGRARFSDEQIAAMRAAVASGETQRSVADRFGLHSATVSRIVRFERRAA